MKCKDTTRSTGNDNNLCPNKTEVDIFYFVKVMDKILCSVSSEAPGIFDRINGWPNWFCNIYYFSSCGHFVARFLCTQYNS